MPLKIKITIKYWEVTYTTLLILISTEILTIDQVTEGTDQSQADTESGNEILSNCNNNSHCFSNYNVHNQHNYFR